MLVFYCYFVGGWYGSCVRSIVLQSVSTTKYQLVDYYGVSILLNQINLAGRSVFYCLYGRVPLKKKYKKGPTWQHFVARLTSFTFTTITPTFTDSKTTTEKTIGFATSPLLFLLLNQGRKMNWRTRWSYMKSRNSYSHYQREWNS